MNEAPLAAIQEETDIRELKGALLNLVDLHVRKEYLNEIESASIVPPSYRQLAIIPERSMRLFHIEKISYSLEAKISDKIKVVFESLTPDCGSVVFFLDGKKNHVNLYMGVCTEYANNLAGQFSLSYGAFNAVYPGSDCRRLKNNENAALIDEFFPKNERLSVAAISASAMSSYEDKLSSVERIDSLIEAMKHKPFTLMVIAEPISRNELVEKRRELENFYSGIYPYQKQEITLSQNESRSFSKSFSTTITESSSVSKGRSNSHSEGDSTGTNTQTQPDNYDRERTTAKNNLIGMGITAALAVVGGLSAGAAFGKNALSTLFFGGNSVINIVNSVNTLSHKKEEEKKLVSDNRSHSTNDTYGEQKNETLGNSRAQQEGTGESDSYTNGKNVQVSYINKSVVDLLNRIDMQIAELEEAEKTPMFNVGAYFIAGDEETAVSAANIYRSVVSSYGSLKRSPNVYKWSDEKDVAIITEYLKRGIHPLFSFETDGYSVYPQMSIAQPIKSDDMPAYFCLPEKTMPGISVVKHAAFTRDVIYRNRYNEDVDDERIEIGKIFYMGKEDDETAVTIPVNELTKHMFVAGATGVGKSNYCYQLIDSLINMGKKVLIIEPAKGEYPKVFGGREDFEVYGTNVGISQLLRINPFAFPDGISVYEHIESLMDIFSNAWPMYSAMPAILKDALEQIYERNGFDLKYQIRTGYEVFPTFTDLLDVLPEIIKESEYSKEVQGNYIGALVTRVKSLTNGVYSTIFCSNEIGDEKLFDKNVIIDISRIRSEETKALIMGVLVNRLSEYRTCSGIMNSPLRHITLLEEAHHLLRRHSSSSVEGADMRGASVEMISNAIAEMRTYGEGFVIADQSPSIMDHSVISNTQTKVFFMLPEREDRSVAAGSLELHTDRQGELARLPIGVAVVYQNAWVEPVMTKIRYFDKSLMKAYDYSPRDISSDKRELLGQTLAVMLYKRVTAMNKESSYNENLIARIMNKDYSWLGNIELECKRVLNDRMRIIQSKNSSSDISSLYSLVADFEKQFYSPSNKKSLEACIDNMRLQIGKSFDLNHAEIDELIGTLIFSKRTDSKSALRLYGEYCKLVQKK